LNVSKDEPWHFGRLMAVLEAITSKPGLSTYREIAGEVGLPVGSTYRLVQSLISAGLCWRQPNGTLAPAARLARLGLRAIEPVHPFPHYQNLVKDLSRATGTSASIGIFMGGAILLIARHEWEALPRQGARVGEIMPPHRSARGTVILAQLPENQRMELVRRSVGGEAAAVLERLRPELNRAWSYGYALDEDDDTTGLRCLATPVFDAAGSLSGAIAISGLSDCFTRSVALSCVPRLKEMSANFTNALSSLQ